MKRQAWLLLILFVLISVACCFEARRFVSFETLTKNELLVWVELDRKRLTVYENGTAAAVFPIAVGSADTPSPIGVFRVVSRFVPEMSGFGTRFLGLNVPWGAYGIHGTNHPDWQQCFPWLYSVKSQGCGSFVSNDPERNAGGVGGRSIRSHELGHTHPSGRGPGRRCDAASEAPDAAGFSFLRCGRRIWISYPARGDRREKSVFPSIR